MVAKKEEKQVNALGAETGIVALDLVLGGYLPFGKIIELNGESGCVDKDTEFFTGSGWKKISEYKKGDKVLQYDLKTGEATLTKPDNYIKLECTKLTEVKSSKGLNQCLTDNHIVPYVTQKGDWRTATFDKIIEKHNRNEYGFSGKFRTTFTYNMATAGILLSTSMLRLATVAIIMGEFSSKNSNHCSITLHDLGSGKEKIKKLKTWLSLSKITCEENSSGYVHTFWFDAPFRHFPKEWYQCNSWQLKIIAEELQQWFKVGNEIFVDNKNDADFIQFAFSATNRKATVITDTKNCYTVKISTRSLITMQGVTPVVKTPEDGYCYCFTVPTGYLVLRRGGCIFITGNCGKSTLSLYMAGKLCKQGKKVYYIDIERGVTDGIMKNMGLDKYLGTNFILDQETSLYSELQAVMDTQLGKDPKDRTKKPVRNKETADVIILDSLAMLMPDGSKEKTIENNVNNNMLAARYATQMFKDIVGDLAEVGTTFWFINHTQTKMRKIGFSMQQAYQDSAGSSIVKYGPDVRLYLSGTKEVKVTRKTILGNQEARIGAISDIWTKKSRVADNGVKIPIKLIDAFGAFNGYTLRPICENLGWITGSGGHYYAKECIVPKDLKDKCKEDKGFYICGTDNVEIYCQQYAGVIVEQLKKSGLYHLTLDRAEHKTMLDVVQKTEAKK